MAATRRRFGRSPWAPPCRTTAFPRTGEPILGQYNIRPYIGITSTPVIDRAKRLMFVVAKIAEPQCPGVDEATAACPVVNRIHAISIVTGEVVRKADIQLPMQNPNVPARDVARRHLQRAALLLANGRVYAAFGAHQDAPPFQGWLMSFDEDTLVPRDPVFCTTPGGEMGGIWQAGNGPAVDEAGNLYLMTGNGTFDPEAKQFGGTLLKLSPSLTPEGWFAPANVDALNALDVDLGSAGPMVLPESNLVVGGGKDGKLFFVSRSNPGGRQPHHWWRDGTGPPDQFFQASRPWRISGLSWFPLLFNVGYHHIHGSPVYWNGPGGPMLYVWPEEDNVKAFPYDPVRRQFRTRPIKGMMGNRGMPGGFSVDLGERQPRRNPLGGNSLPGRRLGGDRSRVDACIPRRHPRASVEHRRERRIRQLRFREERSAYGGQRKGVPGDLLRPTQCLRPAFPIRGADSRRRRSPGTRAIADIAKVPPVTVRTTR